MLRRPLLLSMPLLAFAFTSLAPLRDARACGGCFHPPPTQETESVVTDHRMVFSISTTQTVLWDQIRYSGNPSEFAWVLPVHPGARVEAASDAFIAALEASTDVVVSGPQVNCPGGGGSSGGSIGCGSSGSDSAFGGSASLEDGGYANGPGVQVVSESVVGPYETVTVRASQGDALETWLNANGFEVSAAMQPTLSAYAQEGFDFIALKLRPGQGIRAMQPVRVITPGADLSLPLRMVAAGVGADVGLTLYVIGEGRYAVQNFPNVSIDRTALTWDPYANRSNYAALAEAAMTAGDGRGWITESAGPPDLSPYGASYSSTNPPLAATYRALCRPTLVPPCDAGAGFGGSDAASDAGVIDAAPAPTPTCTITPSCDDLAVATDGLHLENVRVTRLRAHLPVAALAIGDLRLTAEPTQQTVSTRMSASKFTDPSYKPCGNSAAPSSDSGCACRSAAGDRAAGTWVIAAATALAVSAMTRRVRRRR